MPRRATPINLYKRGWGPLILLPHPIEAASGHRRLQDFRDAEERDRWRSSWRRLPRLCALVVALTRQQLSEDAALDWRWRRMGSGGEPCSEQESDVIWGVPPPVGGVPSFLDVLETFAVAWYWAGFPVPADYRNANGRPRRPQPQEHTYASGTHS